MVIMFSYKKHIQVAMTSTLFKFKIPIVSVQMFSPNILVVAYLASLNQKLVILGLFFFIFFFSNQLNIGKRMFYINFANDQIRTADLWFRKRPLYQMSHTTARAPFLCNAFVRLPTPTPNDEIKLQLEMEMEATTIQK